MREPRGIAIHFGRQELERDLLTELQVIGAEHLAHPALTELADNTVAPPEDRAGLEAPVVDGA